MNETIQKLFTVADAVAEALGAPPVARVALHAVDEFVGELTRENDGSIRLMQAAGASENKASHLVGLREAIRFELQNQVSLEHTLDHIMAEVARRMP